MRENAETTKIRIVYDASRKDRKLGVSLNDCLHVGPSLTPMILDVLLRFRANPVALVGDIEKASILRDGENNAPDAEKNANAFAELVQCLDDRSLALIIREAIDDGRKALAVLREQYQGKGKPRVIALYTELTSLKLRETESTTDYIFSSGEIGDRPEISRRNYQRWLIGSDGFERLARKFQNLHNCDNTEGSADNFC